MANIKGVLFAICLFMISVAYAEYRCDWYVLSGGGGFAEGTNFKAGTSAIQTAIGFTQSTNFKASLGFWAIVESLQVGIKEQRQNLQEQKLVTHLFPAKPNPFLSWTTIQYSLAQQLPVTLKVYDVTGREVKTFVQAKQKPGIYTINWNGKDQKGRHLAQGVYFIKFHTTDYTMTRKLLLMR